ncbi:MAG: hypothetical protein M3Z33_12295 [Actinomycetota bacterium]|nr:hypothetical protein [Actinomycetota bacterium]
MRRWRIVAVVAIVTLVGAGLVVGRGRATTCPAVAFGHKEKMYGISSKDIGRRLSCRTVRAVAREAAVRHFTGRVRGWTIVYHRDCQCYTASRVLAGRRAAFTFNATKRR